MSLVNDMLRDLEQRWPEAVANHQEVAASLDSSRSFAWRMPLLGVLMFGLAFLLVFFLAQAQVAQAPQEETAIAPVEGRGTLIESASSMPAKAVAQHFGSHVNQQHMDSDLRQNDVDQQNPPEQDPPQQQAQQVAAAPAHAPAASTRATADEDPPAIAAVTESLESRERRHLLRAQRLSAAGQLGSAVELLAQFMEAEPAATQAAEALFDMYLQQGALQAAGELLQRDSGFSPLQTAFMQAQLAVRAEDYATAAAWLQQHNPPLPEQQDYVAMRAALQHKLGEYEQAATLYRRLVAAVPGQPRYWFGLAVCLDEFDTAGALTAYRQVQNLSRGAESYSAYVDQRVRLLARL